MLLGRSLTQVRYASSKSLKPHPRPFKRRLLEAAVAPIMPPEAPKQCLPVYEKQRILQEYEAEFAPIELALVDKIKEWIREEEFKVMAVCQFLPIKAYPLHFAKNQLRLKGIEFRNYNARIMVKVFEGTPLDVLTPMFHDIITCTLYGRDINAIKTIITETKKSHFLFPLAITYGSRILSLDEMKELTELQNPEQIRAQTVQLLQTIPSQLTSTLDYHPRDLTSILDRIPAQQQ